MIKLNFVLILIIINICQVFSAITIKYSNLDLSKAPAGYIEVEVFQDNVPIDNLTVDDVLIIELTRTKKPDKVEKISGTKFAISWRTPLETYPTYIKPTNPDDVPLIGLSLIISHDGEIGKLSIPYENPGLPILVIKEAHSGIQQKELSFEKTNKNQIYVVAFTNKGSIDKKLRLDSITFTSPYFSYNWQGTSFDMYSRPPMELENSTHYLVDINYQSPGDNRPIRALMQLHYNNGMIKSLPLLAGNLEVKQTTMLQLLKPNGGEKLTPCETYEIKWKGHSKDQPVIVEYSIDNGRSWLQIAKVMDSVYKWIVPNVETSSALVRVRQEFTKANEVVLKEDWSNITKIAFNSNGAKAIGVNTQGNIYEFDIYNQPNAPLNKYFASLSTNNLININVDYINNDNEITYFFRENYFSLPKAAYYKVGVSPSYKTIPSPIDLNKVYTDPKRRFFITKNTFEPKFYVLDINNLSILNSVITKMPVSSISFNKSGDTLATIEIDGRISLYRIVDANNIVKIKNFFVEYTAIPVNIKFSPNGQFLAISVMQEDNVGTDTYLYDLEKQMIVRTFRPAVNEPVEVDFSPSTNAIVIGSPNLDQIVIYDLTGSGTKSVLAGHFNSMNDMRLDPEGFAILSSSNGEGNFKHRSFSYPELDVSDNNFSIVAANLTIIQPQIQPIIIGTDNFYTFTAEICNNSDVPVYIYDVSTQNETHVKILNSILSDTLYPNNCFELQINIAPQDTGKIEDQVIFHSCYKDFIFPISFQSLDRKLTLINPNGNIFEETCLRTSKLTKFPIFRNDDTIDVLINRIKIEDGYGNIFKIEDFTYDTIIKPGETLYLNISFSPEELKEYSCNLFIYHSNQNNVVKRVLLKGKGIGTFLTVSHEKLMFINEINNRKLIVKNISQQRTTLTEVHFEPDGYYFLNTPLPIVIEKNQSVELDIVRKNTSIEPVQIYFTAIPCLASNAIILDNYVGTSQLKIGKVEADPRKNAKIEISFVNTENYPYQGERFFEGEISINQRAFYPLSIFSKYGNAKISSNQVVDNKRLIKFRIEGDFGVNGTLCEITGVSGLTDEVISPIEWKNSIFWGTSVQTNVLDGELRLTNICENRLINSKSTFINSISPIPAKDIINLSINNEAPTTAYIEITDIFGNVIMKTEAIYLSSGSGILLPINVSYMSNGMYKLALHTQKETIIEKIIILR